MFRSFKVDHKNRNQAFNYQRIRGNLKNLKSPSIQYKPGRRMRGREEGRKERQNKGEEQLIRSMVNKKDRMIQF